MKDETSYTASLGTSESRFKIDNLYNSNFQPKKSQKSLNPF